MQSVFASNSAMSVICDSLPAFSGDWLAAFVLVLGRMGGLVGLAPVFGAPAVPLPVRAALATALALLVTPTQQARLELPPGAADYLALLFIEAGLGAAMGMSVAALIAGVRAAGQLAEQQTGLALGELFGPFAGRYEPVLQRFYAVLAITLFFLIGGHRIVLRAVLESFEVVPISQFQLSETAVAALSVLVGQSFQIALRVAAPLVVTLLLAGIALGFLARTVPQLQVLVTAMPLRVLLGLFTLAAVVVALGPLIGEQTHLLIAVLGRGMYGISPAPHH